MKPICVKCHRFFRVKKVGVYIREGMPVGGDVRALPGIEHDHLWKDYKLWSVDLMECQGCGHQIMAGAGLVAVSEHYHDNFVAMVERFNATFRVNDC